MSESKPYKPLTRKGYRALAEEHRQLLEEERPKVVDGVATAAAEGDRSENAEYIYGKKRLREIDKRLRYLTALIDEAQVIDPENIRSDRIEFGATVSILDEDDVSKTWTIVGMGEADASQGTISYKSPLARALFNKKVGDVILLKRPAGDMEFEVTNIEYVAV